MPITFGAIGDIISVCLLVKDLVETLDKARGSKPEYQSAIRELWILDRALLEVDLLTRLHGDGATPELRGLCETAKQAATRCKDLISKFHDRIQKYKSTFEESNNPGILKSAALQLRWRLEEKDALDQLRVEVAGTSSSLQMLLATASVTLMSISKKQLNDRLDEAKEQADTKNNQQSVTLLSIQDRLEDANRQIESGNSILGKVSDAMRLDWLRQLGSELKALMRRAIATNIATYHAVLSIQAILPSRLERGMIEEPFILEDPIGRVAPVHLQFVTSWEAFNAILEVRFRDIQGYSKIKQRKYGLQDRSTGRDILQTRRWDGAFLPGQRVEMSLLFETKGGTVSDDAHVFCPGCQATSAGGNEADIQCERCGMWFRRITVIREVEARPPVPLPKPWTAKPEFGKSTLAFQIVGPLKAGRKRTAPDDLEGEEEAREFKRVRIIQAKEQVKTRKFGQARPGKEYTTFSKLQAPSSVKKTLWQDSKALDAELCASSSSNELEKFRQQMSALKPRPGSRDTSEEIERVFMSRAISGDPANLKPKIKETSTSKAYENAQLREPSFLHSHGFSGRNATDPHSSAALGTTIRSNGPLFRWRYSSLVHQGIPNIDPPGIPPVDPRLYKLLGLDSWDVPTPSIVQAYKQRVRECLSCGSLNTACLAAAEQLKGVLDSILETLTNTRMREEYHRTGCVTSRYPEHIFPFIQNAIAHGRLVEAVERLCRCGMPCWKVWMIWENEDSPLGISRSKGRKDHYDVLGLPRNASQADIKIRYRAQAIKNHPDKNPGDEAALKHFEELSEAYDVLGDEVRRSYYDFITSKGS
ncbi:Nn.00g114820.m01.CDS01 [Neocucurbitaria sp. VM-36]